MNISECFFHSLNSKGTYGLTAPALIHSIDSNSTQHMKLCLHSLNLICEYHWRIPSYKCILVCAFMPQIFTHKELMQNQEIPISNKTTFYPPFWKTAPFLELHKDKMCDGIALYFYPLYLYLRKKGTWWTWMEPVYVSTLTCKTSIFVIQWHTWKANSTVLHMLPLMQDSLYMCTHYGSYMYATAKYIHIHPI